MTMNNAFTSWANWVKTKLAADGVTVNVEMRDTADLAKPYLYLEQGPETEESEWVWSCFAQARLVCEAVGEEDLKVTAGRLKDQIIASLRNPGLLPKYNYSTTPETLTGGTVQQKFVTVSPELSGNPKQSEKVIRLELYTNTNS